MKASKSTKQKKQGRGKGGGSFQQFFIWHGEKIVVGIVAVVALWFALQGLGYKTLDWQPGALEEVSTTAEKAIRENTRTAAEEGIKIFDYDTYAEQIKEPIPAAPYRSEAPWYPALSGSSRSAPPPQDSNPTSQDETQ